MKTQYPMIPFPLIVKATDGDTEAINQILHHYRGYITKRSLRLMKDEYGNQSMVVDEVLRGRMETRLITKILSFENLKYCLRTIAKINGVNNKIPTTINVRKIL